MAVQSIIPSFTVNNSGALRVCNSDALHFRHDSSSIIYYVHKNAHSTYWPKNAYILFDCVRVQFKRPNKQTKLPQQLNFRFAPLNRRHTVRQRMYSIAACHAWHTNNEYMRLRPSHHSTLCESQHTRIGAVYIFSLPTEFHGTAWERRCHRSEVPRNVNKTNATHKIQSFIAQKHKQSQSQSVQLEKKTVINPAHSASSLASSRVFVSSFSFMFFFPILLIKFHFDCRITRNRMAHRQPIIMP